MTGKIDKKKLTAALELLGEDTATLVKIEKVLTMLPGISPKADRLIANCRDILGKINKVGEGAVLELSAEKLPEKTKKGKQRKKLILLLLTNWKNLGSEVQRINDLTTAVGTATTGVKTAKILATMKGPLGVVTIGAAVIVAGSKLLNNMAVEVNVVNNGCRPIGPFLKQEIDLPGLNLPEKAIASGDEGVIKLPPIKLNVVITEIYSQVIAFGFRKDFSVPNEYKEIVFDGQSLMGKETEIDLGSTKKHQLTIKCK